MGYIKCPRCDLNYILEGEDYCAVCKAELKIVPSLLFGDEDEPHEDEKLCPICKTNYIHVLEDCCDSCKHKKQFYDSEPDADADLENDEKWRFQSWVLSTYWRNGMSAGAVFMTRSPLKKINANNSHFLLDKS